MARTSRLVSIDCFRGFAVLAMVLASYLTGSEDLPPGSVTYLLPASPPSTSARPA